MSTTPCDNKTTASNEIQWAMYAGRWIERFVRAKQTVTIMLRIFLQFFTLIVPLSAQEKWVI